MNIGKKDRVRIGDILGAVAGESGMEEQKEIAGLFNAKIHEV